ncbi:hypothetical protein [Novosphingobium sp.]|uniref:hypothetical protein n=1 Tax=Novosphingobium sp. TaxID=1874826 RepID=UPI00260A36D5|nr:hypothetical protein [Novosphingobium sp.]
MTFERRVLRIACLAVCAVASLSCAEIASADVKDTSSQEATCKDIGFRPRTVAFADCVMKLLSRSQSQSEESSYQPVHLVERQRQQKPPTPLTTGLSPDERTCTDYGFKKGSTAFGGCLLQLGQAKQQAQFAQQQYELQVQQYRQQVAAYEAQQQAIAKERERRKWAALATFGFGMAGSNSPTLGGGMADGMRALNGQPPLQQPVPPVPPAPQNYTVRLPNGNQIYCNYNAAASYMSCR